MAGGLPLSPPFDPGPPKAWPLLPPPGLPPPGPPPPGLPPPSESGDPGVWLPAGLPGRLVGALPLPLLVPSNPGSFPGTGWCNGAEVVYVMAKPS